MVREHKKSMSQKLRMDGRDYSRVGWYFVTLGADYHRHYFGRIEDCEMKPNALGRLVETYWAAIPEHYSHIQLGAWQLMPNHFHGLVRIVRPGGAGLGEVLNLFKGSVTREARRSSAVEPVIARHGGKEPGKVWAPNYYDVICFDAAELGIKENYVCANPRRWALRDVPQGRIRRSRYKGNKVLLNASGSRRALRVSRRASGVEIEQLRTGLANFDGIVCSTFLSSGERDCLKTLLAGSARVIWVVPMAMPESIPVNWTNAFLEQRALWLSAFPDEQTDVTRDNCQQANHWVEQFCAHAPGD